MTVEELRDELSCLPGDAEVRLAMQPNYPMEYTIEAVIEVRTGSGEVRDAEDTLWDLRHEEGADPQEIADAQDEVARLETIRDNTPAAVWIAEGSQTGYLSGDVSQELGWR